MTFTAALSRDVGIAPVIVHLDDPELSATDVLVRVEATGICSTDIEAMNGSFATPFPTVLGHEAAGVVEEVGRSVREVRVGDRVVCNWNPSCGLCFYCSRNQPILCEACLSSLPTGSLPDGSSRLSMRGQRLNHFLFVSSFAQYAVVPESGVVAVAGELPFEEACLIGCAVSTGFGAVVRIAKVPPGAIVLVLGCGAVGLSVIQAAAAVGAEEIIGSDPSPIRRALASRLGATAVLDPLDGPVPNAVRESTHGRGADFVFEAAGRLEAMRTAVEASRPGGTIVLLGKVPPQEELCLPFGTIAGERVITRSSYGGVRPHRDFPLIARLAVEGRLSMREMISARLPLSRLEEGLELARYGSAVRVVVSPWLLDDVAAAS